MRSSYLTHDLGKMLTATVTAFQPVVCVELGVLDGYSTIAIAKGLKDNKDKRGGGGTLAAFDLFEDYPYAHSTLTEAWHNIQQAGVEEFVSLEKADAFTVHERYQPNSVGFLHVDLSNTGETLNQIMPAWDSKLVQGGVVAFEGGSAERDQVEWMVKYDKLPIKPVMESHPIIAEKYVFGTYFAFPSLSILLKKR